jgi:hypothetical protein
LQLLPVLIFINLLIVAAGLKFQRSPGYMDAAYYYIGARQLAAGQGLTEPVLWNYLDDPAGLPHPSHTYWMPLTSLASTPALLLFKNSGFLVARLPLSLLAGILPWLVAALAAHLDPAASAAQRTRRWLLAWALATFSGFYLQYLTLTDSFVLYMLLGTGFLWLGFGLHSRRGAPVPPGKWLWLRFLLLGAVAGLLHLTRADGLVWLLAVVPAAGWAVARPFYRRPRFYTLLVLAALGYLLVAGWWLARNLQLYGSPLPGGAQTLWLTTYDDTYAYPATGLTFENWWARGLSAALFERARALLWNLANLVGVQGLVILLPLMLLGLWRLRERRFVQAAAGLWLLTFIVMSVVFPFAGSRGGYLHSGAAFQPLFWAAVPLGLDVIIDWGTRHRGWKRNQAWPVFGAGIAVLGVALTVGLYAVRVVGPNPSATRWDADERRFLQVDQELEALKIPEDAVIMVNNPPGFNAATRRPAVVLPNGGTDTALAAACRYGAGYLLLDINAPALLRPLFDHPASLPGLTYLQSVSGVQIYRVTACP